MERVLGEKHPDTLTVVASLASLLQGQGNITEALVLYQRVSEGREGAGR